MPSLERHFCAPYRDWILCLKIATRPLLLFLITVLYTRNNFLQAMDDPPKSPSLPWRVSSSIVMGVSGFLTRIFYTGMNSVEVHGLDNFLELLDKRKDIEGRERGLLTSTLILILRNDTSWADRTGRSFEPHMRVRTYTAQFITVERTKARNTLMTESRSGTQLIGIISQNR